MSEQKYPCDVIQDLLPLYQDGVCSDGSREIVREHLQTCGGCREVAARLGNYEVDETLTKEKQNILTTHEKQEKRRAYTVGMVTAGVLLIPVVVCLICNLAIGHGLDWFFIVLASLLLVASLTVVPLMAPAKKGLWTTGSFTAALLLLLAVCCIYTGGDWFFVAAAACVLGLSAVLAPYIVRQLPLPEKAARHRGLLVISWDTAWLYALIVTCGVFVGGGSFYWRLSLTVTSYCLLFPWVIFLTVRYLKANACVKTGLLVIAVGVLTAFANDVISVLSGIPSENSLFDADISVGFSTADWLVFGANALVLILVISVVVGAAFLLVGGKQDKKRKNEK